MVSVWTSVCLYVCASVCLSVHQSYICPSVRPTVCPDDNLSKCQEILTKLGTCIDMKEIWFGIANGQISSMFDRIICPRYNNGGVL